MTDHSQHSITPPTDLIEKWYASADNVGEDVIEGVAVRAARWGADQELEQCSAWLDFNYPSVNIGALRSDRRPKPPSLKRQALEQLRRMEQAGALDCNIDAIRKFIETSPENP